MAEIIDLKAACLEVGPENQANRYHALEIYNYFEKLENLVVIPEENVYNDLKVGELKIV